MVSAEKPARALQPFVRSYVHLDMHLAAQRLVQPVPAHTWSAIEFTFRDPFEVWSGDESHHETAHPVAVIGAQTHRRVHLAMQGRIETFIIVFEPGGLSRLLSIPADALTNQHFEGRAVLGDAADELWSRLAESTSFSQRSRIADAYLLARWAGRRPQSDVTAAARELLGRRGCLRISDVAERAGLSVRQFERGFNSEIGMRPKLFARVVRFESALRIKKRTPSLRWTDIAHALGYHDQMHMVHDFQLLSGSTPSDATPRLDMFVDGELE